MEISHVSAFYGEGENKNQALSDVNFTIDEGTICAIIGPSGCGKSSLLHIIGGLTQNYEGKVLFKGEKIDNRKQRIGFIQQNYGLLPWNTVWENAVMGLKIKGDKVKDRYEEVEEILAGLGLLHKKDFYPCQLSGGEEQRVSIAQSFLLRPDILLMDEAFSALDAINREKIQDIFLQIWQKHQVTSVFVTHSIEEAIFVGEKIVVLTPSPGTVGKIIENPLFGKENLRLTGEYNDMAVALRKVVGELWEK